MIPEVNRPSPSRPEVFDDLVFRTDISIQDFDFRSEDFGEPLALHESTFDHTSTTIAKMESADSRHAFQPTRWTLVMQVKGDGEDAHKAMTELCESYWFPLYAFARGSKWSAADAEDLVQGFFVRLIRNRLFDAAEEERGKLRTFLLTSFRRYAKDEMVKLRAAKRGGDSEHISFDFSEAESWYADEKVDAETPEQLYDRQWAITVIEKALANMKAHAESQNKGKEFDLMKPLLMEETNSDDFSRIAAELGISPNAAKIQIHRLRSRFRETVRAEIRETQLEGTEEDDELRYLLSQLSRS